MDTSAVMGSALPPVSSSLVSISRSVEPSLNLGTGNGSRASFKLCLKRGVCRDEGMEVKGSGEGGGGVVATKGGSS